MKKKTPKKYASYSIFMENPVILALMVFLAGVFINYILETEAMKGFFNWCGYYYNYSIYWFNTTFPPMFQNHPYIRVSPLSNPFTADVFAVINPWMWLRGFALSSFIICNIVTMLQIKIIPPKKIITAGVLIIVLQYIYYLINVNSPITPNSIIFLIQKHYGDLLVLFILSIIGMLLGGEYAVFLYRNEKITIQTNRDLPNIRVTSTNKWDD